MEPQLVLNNHNEDSTLLQLANQTCLSVQWHLLTVAIGPRYFIVVMETQTSRLVRLVQTRDDSVPELRQTFTLQLNSASGGAVLSPVPEASKATVTYAASDYPHGLVQFQLPELTVVKEDQGNVR